MTPNSQTVDDYMEGFRQSDRARILECLTEDVEWIVPGAFHVRGKADFAAHIVDDGFVANPEIAVSRLVEEHDVVVAEGSVRTQRTDGTILNLVFCDVFELRDAKIRRLVSYLMEIRS
jgi:ketosteroid isomerase-like protein